MSGSSLSSAGLDPRRRRILFRAGAAACARWTSRSAISPTPISPNSSEDELARIRALARPARSRKSSPGSPARRRSPAAFDTPLFARLRAAPLLGDAPERQTLLNAPVALANRLRQSGAVTLARAPEGFDAFVVADLARALAREAEAARGRADLRRARLRCARRTSSTRSPSPRRRSRRCICPPGIASPTTASRPTPRSSAQRMTALARLALTRGARERPRMLVDHRQRASTQRVPPKSFVAAAGVFGRARQQRSTWTTSRAGWRPTAFPARAIVRDVGDYAQRGGILDLYRAGRAGADPARLLRRHAGIDPLVRSRRRSAASASCARSISCR